MTLKDVHRLVGQGSAARFVRYTIVRDAALAWQSGGHDLGGVTIFVGAGTCDILVIIIAKILFTNGSLCHDCILQVFHHLVLRARLDLERADATLLFEELCLLLFKSINTLFETLIVEAHLLGVILELGDFFFSQAEQVLVTLELQFFLTLFFLLTFHLFFEQFFLILEFVLHALNVQLELLFDLDVITDFGLVLL